MKHLATIFLLLCLGATTLQAQQAIINELSSDPTAWDGSGGEFIELYCPLGGGDCDISCWTVSDAQGLIKIPENTIITEGDYYLIAHGPSFSCDSCDFFGIPIDLNTATCNCLNGGVYGVGVDGKPAMVLGRGGNDGEIVYLLDDTNVLIDGLKFDNASAVYLPTGGDIMGVAVGACSGSVVHLTDPNGAAIVNVGGAHIGCNTSFMRDTDGSATWVTDNHPTPGISNTARGDNAFDYEYRLDGGVWTTMTKNGTGNDRTFSLNNCDADSVEFRVIVRNYQHVITGLYDNAGLVGSYFESPQTGRIAWNTIQGLGAVENEEVRLVSQKLPINTGASTYILQWSDYKRGMGSTSFTSTNECYERMTFTLTQNETITSAEVICSDYLAGINQVNVTPSSITGLTYTLYDDIGDQSNLIRTNNTGIFVLGSGDIASVGYYVVVTGACNSVVANQGTGSFCLSDPPCPSITNSDFTVNGIVCGSSVQNIATESFEGAIDVGYTSSGVFSDGTNDYFDLVGDGTDPTGLPAYTGQDGTQYWAGEDTQDGDNPNASGISSITLSNININGFINVQVGGLFAAGSTVAYDGTDFVQIFVNIDGGGFNLIGAFEDDGSGVLREDTDLDGVGDGNGLGIAFQDFIFDLGATGTSIDIRIDVFMTAGDEAIAFDNLIVQGTVVAACTACPNDTVTISVAGEDLPGGGTIDWYSNTSSSFNPYNSEGEYLGSTQLPPSTVCVSSTLVLNEILYRPALSNGQSPNTGEYIELLGTPGTDIGCTVLTDGDWTITIPAGTTVPADGLFTIGNDLVYGAGTFDLDAETCGCFTDGFGGNGLLILTDAGEYVSMFDATGTFTQGVVYGTPTGTNIPPDGNNSTGGLISTAGLAGCPSSVTIPAVGSFETATGGLAVNESLIRNPDGSGGWTGQADGSVNACNSVPMPTIPDFDYIIDGDDCNNTLFIKGIINPHPNTVSCPNTDAQAATIEHEIQITCPTVDMNPDSIEICSDALPAVLTLTTTGFADGTDVNLYYTVNGAATTSTATVNSNTTNLNITESGEIVLTEVEPVSGASCSAVTSDTAYVTVLTTPSAPSISSANIICDATTVLLSSTGATTYEWSYNSSFTPIEATAEDFLANAPSTVFARAINQDDDGSLVCTSPSNSIVLTTTPCPDITYPIELIDFYGYWENHEVKLHWTTVTELNNDYFEIEHSLNGIDYEYLTTVDGAGNSIQHRNYHAVDPNPKMGWNYYKLYQVDFDGTRNEVGIVVVSVNEEVLDWVIYPVPVEDELIIRLADDMAIEGTTLTIYNSLGQIMATQILDTSTNIYTINTDDWAAGIYTVKMSDIVRERTQKITKY